MMAANPNHHPATGDVDRGSIAKMNSTDLHEFNERTRYLLSTVRSDLSRRVVYIDRAQHLAAAVKERCVPL
jgi:hypothetical protein